MLAIAGCSFEPGIATDAAPSGDGPGADGFVGSIDVAHLGGDEEAKLTGTAAWIIDAETTVDTTTGEVDPPLPAGVVVIASAAQQSDGPDVMVIQATEIEVQDDLDVVGTRPLILVATSRIVLDNATIDISASKARPGPGGFASDLGPGAGHLGSRAEAADGGGGGGSYGTAGGPGGIGGQAGALGGAPGTVYGGSMVLQGGSGGAKGVALDSGCDSPGGGGGGAIQLTAPRIAGSSNATVNAGGGGGSRGVTCDTDGPAGGGGGAGGMIFLDAPMLTGMIRLVAQGGGGGEGASADGSNDGGDGGDAGEFTGVAGRSNSPGGEGGQGAGSNPAEPGKAPIDADTNGNGGGGGGGTGRIFYRHSLSNPYSATPPALPG